MQIRILTLNVWGVRYISKFIDQRLQALIEFLTEIDTNYDIVGLQEVWSKTDYVYIKENIKQTFPYSYYFLSGLIGSGCCMFSKYPIIAVYEHRYTLNGFPHKIQHGDWFCGKLIGLCKILMNGSIINVYNTHLHASYHDVIPKDIYLGHRICQTYELIQFIESTSSVDKAEMIILMGDLNLKESDLGFQLIKNILKLNDAFTQRIDKNKFDPTIGNSGETANRYDNPYVSHHKADSQAKRIDYVLYRSKNDNLNCLECYPTLHKVPNSSNKLHYSDHLAVYALLEIDETKSKVKSILTNHNEQLNEDSEKNLRSACIIVEESLQRIQRQRIYSLFGVFFLSMIFILFNEQFLSHNHLLTIAIFFKNFFSLIGIAYGLWSICFGKPFERNSLRSTLNAIHLRLRTPRFFY